MNPNNQNVMAVLQQEAMRRSAGLGNSGAGVPGGMPTTNAPAPSNPVAQQGQTAGQQPPMPESMYQGATQMMQGAQPGGANHIEKALIKRMMMYPPA